ncbi:Uma2 family endonuclease [Streptomyces sp. CSDS2]|uniref:Uma2 family endonuclease n=1 Tax=Streptomyces sp. CSDS2 TaxID=3055051 RepID=UPI0025AF43EC|nr:Uma2 family endonuclease [Streptomyces sp. CSDS2]MDN3258294.1 Uma2 family endonuclease [Streptomyces sp. CSDS2]
MSAALEASAPVWPVPPEGGWAADDLDTLSGLPPHTQLIDASLVFACPQSLFHERAMSFCGHQLDSAAPAELEVLHRFTFDIDRQNRPEADVIVLRAEALRSHDQTRVPATSVVLAVEVVSPETLSLDRETKPLKYARAKIPHYWRVENEDGRAAVHVFELEPTTGTYTSTGIFRERMKLDVPFPMDLDLTRIKTRRDRKQ